MSGEALLWVLITGVLLAGYVATWFAALRLAPATTVTSVLVAGGRGDGRPELGRRTARRPIRASSLGYLLILVAVVLVGLAGARRFGRFDASRADADA